MERPRGQNVHTSRIPVGCTCVRPPNSVSMLALFSDSHPRQFFPLLCLASCAFDISTIHRPVMFFAWRLQFWRACCLIDWHSFSVSTLGSAPRWHLVHAKFYHLRPFPLSHVAAPFRRPRYGNPSFFFWRNTGRGHVNRRYSVTACFDGNKRVVSGSEDGSIYIWDINSSKSVVQRLQGHSGEVSSKN